MDGTLTSRVRQYLISNSINVEDLKCFMEKRGISYPLELLDAFAEPDHIYLIAGFLRVPASVLFEVTNHDTHYARAVFDEEWPRYKIEAGMSRDEAWKRIVQGRDFKGVKSRATIRRDVQLVLDGLRPPSTMALGCQLPDCSCTTRCRVTGRMLEPGDWP